MPLSDWLDALYRRPRNSRRSKKQPPRRKSARLAGCEPLEERRMLITTIYLDFGQLLPAGGLEVKVSDLRDSMGAKTGPDLANEGPAGNKLVDADKVKLAPLSYDYDGKNGVTADDLVALQRQVLPIVERALAPFDIDVQLASNKDLAGVKKTLERNNKGTGGKNDAYVFVTAVTASRFTAHGGSVGDNASLAGLAAGKDFARSFNGADETVLVFADGVFTAVQKNATSGTRLFNERLAFQLAATALHEAAHTFGLGHTEEEGLEGRLALGDMVKQVTSPNTYNIFTRFELQLEHDAPKTVNNYGRLVADADIGVVDNNRNGKADLAYISGTGVHDLIRLQRDASNANLIHVTVQAFSDQVNGTSVRAHSFDINLLTQAEHGIVIEASLGNDKVDIDPAITTRFTIYGGLGDDYIQGGGGVDIIYGEEGDDGIIGGGGNDWIYGGKGTDNMDGGAGNDHIEGHSGVDTIVGGLGDDFLLGGSQGDHLSGGGGKDYLSGGDGEDTLLGGTENDTLYGGQAHDTINGEAGADEVWNYDGDAVTNDGQDIIRLKPPAIPTSQSSPNPNATSSFVSAKAGFGPHAAFAAMSAPSPNLTGASGPLNDAQAQAIRDGLQQLAGWAPSAGGTVPLVDETAGAALGDILARTGRKGRRIL